MASPQRENGFTPIAHDILEALARQPLTGRHRRLLDLIFRESYGRNRKEALISLRDFSKRTKIGKPHCSSLLRELGLLRMVTGVRVTASGNHHKTAWIFQKDFDQWGVPYRGTVTRDGNGSVPARGNRSRTRAQKKEKKETTAQPAVAGLISHFYDSLKDKIGESPVAFPGAMIAMHFKRTLKSYSSEEISRRVSNWFASEDPFIQRNNWAPGLFFKRFNALQAGPLTGKFSTQEPPTDPYSHLRTKVAV